MRIVIDMQGAQTESRFRGIGRYTLSFAQAIARNKGEHEVFLALNGLLVDSIEPIREAFEGILPEENIRVWYAPGPVRSSDQSNQWRREVAELIREEFLATLKPDIIHVSSLFEGYIDDAVTSIGLLDKKTPVSVSLYDLIPMLNPDHYLKHNEDYERYYKNKFKHLQSAEIYLAISDFSRQEGLTHIGKCEENIINVSTAIEEEFQPTPVEHEEAAKLSKKLNLTKPFILYTGGADERKNLPALIQSLALLPDSLKKEYHLLLAGKISPTEQSNLKGIARSSGLPPETLRFTGYIENRELIQLYNLCELFVFPSWHEGFGLPALEAMACGAPVIGANTSSLPEVIGKDDALFDPHDPSSISIKIKQALKDHDFRAELVQHGLQQAKLFSWDTCAKRAISAFEKLIIARSQEYLPETKTSKRARLAFVSPLPPERSGIADYSAELLPELAKHYDIVVITDQTSFEAPSDKPYSVRNVQWLLKNTAGFDRVIYQFGNSPFHQHMLQLIKSIPGTVVLHDFYLSSLMAFLEEQGTSKNSWTEALYVSHGYGAVKDKFQNGSIAAKLKYPVNLDVLLNAQGVIVHSNYSKKLAEAWYGETFASHFSVIPLLRKPSTGINRSIARAALGLKESDFVICSFGFVDSTKLNHQLVRAWNKSCLAKEARCFLIFVGQNHSGAYGQDLYREIQSGEHPGNIKITGWTAPSIYQQYLASADIAVQLRTSSRGETSAAVLDCMNNGIATIINANGSFDELPTSCIWRLENEFEEHQLTDAIETLWRSGQLRNQLGAQARKHIQAAHSPEHCAEQYKKNIEEFYSSPSPNCSRLIEAVAEIGNCQQPADRYISVAEAIAQSIPERKVYRSLYIDITATCQTDLRTGIERVARALTIELLSHPPKGFRVEPIYLSNSGGAWHYRHAHKYTLQLLGCPSDVLEDEPIQVNSQDIVLGLDISGDKLSSAFESGLLSKIKNIGAKIYFVVYDLLPLSHPHHFPPGTEEQHKRWLKSVARTDGAICISRSVAKEMRKWLTQSSISNRRKFIVDWFHLGADIEKTAPSLGVPVNAGQLIDEISSRTTFLMVGTVEPRKGYLDALEAFSGLWRNGANLNLVIVGKEGWTNLPDEMRRTIPNTITALREHPLYNKRLFWLEDTSDEFLEEIYKASACLIAASENEGFGLPLIEAAQRGLPIIARDIPVFREVAGSYAYYFDNRIGLSTAITKWLDAYKEGQHPKSGEIPYLKWSESALSLVQHITKTSEIHHLQTRQEQQSCNWRNHAPHNQTPLDQTRTRVLEGGFRNTPDD